MLVSEVMLQQTQVARVAPCYERFLARWPTPAALAQSSLADVLRAWQGLGYPRRAQALWRAAAAIDSGGWPRDEAGLRALPGVGAYTARALLTLALGLPCPPPLDVNISRVAARAALGIEIDEAAARDLEQAIEAARPRSLDRREYAFALFDAGALHCRALPRCGGCPLAQRCASRERVALHQPAPARRQARYEGSHRQLRGVLLSASLNSATRLDEDAATAAAARLRPSPDPAAVRRALEELRAERLID